MTDRLHVSGSTRSVLRSENVLYADDDPVHRVTTYIPWSIAEVTGLLQDEVPHQFGIHVHGSVSRAVVACSCQIVESAAARAR